jgi:6-phosphogluconolactonase (cycloisomerase 2 family)
LEGTGLELQNNGTDNLVIATNGGFAFSTALAPGDSYNVKVVVAPHDPVQHCVATSHSGFVTNVNVSNVAIVCTRARPHTVVATNLQALSTYTFDVEHSRFRPRMKWLTGDNYGLPYGPFDIAGSRFIFSGHVFNPSVSTLRLEPRSSFAIEPAGSPVIASLSEGGNYHVDAGGRFFFAHESMMSPQVRVSAISQVDGTLNPIHVYTVGSPSHSMLFHPNGRLALYLGEKYQAYSIDHATGALAPIPGTELPGPTNGRLTFLGPGGRFLYEPLGFATFRPHKIFRVSADTGALTELSLTDPFASSPLPHPNGKLMYLSTETAGYYSIAAHRFDEGSGQPIRTSSFVLFMDDGTYGRGDFDDSGRYFYRATTGGLGDTSAIRGFTVDSATGELSEIPSSPVAVVPGKIGTVSVDESGELLFARASVSSVHIYRIDRATGAVEELPQSPLYGDMSMKGLAETEPAHFRSRFAYAIDTSGTIEAFAVDTDGALNEIAGPQSTIASRVALSVDSRNRFLFALDGLDALLEVYAIDAAHGRLSILGGGPFPTELDPTSLVVDRSGAIVIVASAASRTLSLYTFDDATGEVTLRSGIATIRPPGELALHPALDVLYVVSPSGDEITSYDVDVVGSRLTERTSYPTGSRPSAIAIEPSGKFAYISNSGSNDVSILRMRCASVNTCGEPEVAAAIAAGMQPADIVVDPTGRFVYTANSGSDDISGYQIDPASGMLTPIPGSPFAAGGSPTTLTPDFGGTRLHIAFAIDNRLETFMIDDSTGALTPLGGSIRTTIGAPIALVVTEESY